MWRKDEPRAPSLPAQKNPTPAATVSQIPFLGPDRSTPLPVRSALEAYLTRSLILEGEISGQDDLIIDGEVRGKIRLSGAKLTIGPEGRVTAEIEAREVVVRGAVTGNIRGHDRVQIAATGRAKGEINTRSISIEEGAEVHGVRVNLEKKDERPGATPATASASKPENLNGPLAEKVAQVHV